MGRVWAQKVTLGVVCLLIAILGESLAVNPLVPGTLGLTGSDVDINREPVLRGFYAKDGVTVDFVSERSSLTFHARAVGQGQVLLFSFQDYGAFSRITFYDNSVFLVATVDLDLRRSVIDVTLKKGLALPKSDSSVPHQLLDNINAFETVLHQSSEYELYSAEQKFIELTERVLRTKEAGLIPYASMKLASIGVWGQGTASLPLHRTALRISKNRQLLNIQPPPDPELVAAVNNALHSFRNTSIQHTISERSGCTISDTCDNACFGRCGYGCDCWEWVCGDCDCWIGCQQHDCCCSCKGIWTLCCLNVIAFNCNGYYNPCQVVATVY